jgi:hypothetical protein
MKGAAQEEKSALSNFVAPAFLRKRGAIRVILSNLGVTQLKRHSVKRSYERPQMQRI